MLALSLLILTVGAGLRTLWLRADPPTTAVGIVWHDEGAWVHNARNRALWGTWQTDAWNPMYIAPVFTALEYGAFEAFGVGTWQARLVPVASGLAAVLLLMLGLSAVAGPRVALIGGTLARHQLHLRDVESRGAHGVDDDGADRRELGGVRAVGTPAGLGNRRRRRRRAGIFHQSGRGLLCGGACARRTRHDPGESIGRAQARSRARPG